MKIDSLGREAVLAQEIAFSLCMGVVAVLSRGNPSLSYPEVLWAFAALLAFNLVFHIFLRRSADWVVPLVSIAANTLLVSAVVAYSGGSDSYFWPMYLLPIFTACLHLEPRHAVFALAASCGFLGNFYLDTIMYGPLWMMLAYAVKAGVLGLSAAMTAQFAWRERKARQALAETRGELDRLSCAIAESDASGGRAAPRRRLLEGLIYDLHSQLMSIHGSCEVLLEQVPQGSDLKPDIERIAASARSLRKLTSDIVDMGRPAEPHATDVSLRSILERVTALLDFKVKQKGLRLACEFPPQLPRLRQDAARLQLALLDLLLWVMDHTAFQGRILLKAVSSGDGVELSLGFSSREAGQSAATLSVHSHVLERQHVDLRALEAGDGMELRLSFHARARDRVL